MKRFFITLICIFTSVVSYAGTSEELIRKAETYESKKEWIYALGTYHEAMNISEDSEISKQKFEQLCECIKNGNPGYGEFTVFSMHDEWVNLIKNAEKYFTENFPYKMTYAELSMASADYKNKTANYNLKLIAEQSNFYKQVLEMLKIGYEKTNHSDWNDLEGKYKSLWFMSDGFAMLLHSSWDGSLSSSIDFYRKSVYSTKQEKINKVTEYPVLQNEAKSVYQKEKIALSYLTAPIVPVYKSLAHISGISVCEVPAFASCFEKSMTTYNGQNYSVPLAVPYFTNGKQTCYDIKIGLYDENDNLLVEGTRQTVHTGEFSYNFSNIAQDKMSILDNKKYTVKLLGIWLNYGVYDISLLTDEDIKNNTIRGVVKPLPDIKIETECVEFMDKKLLEEQARLEEERLKMEKKKLEAEELIKFIAVMEKQFEIFSERFNQAKLYTENFSQKSGTGIKFKLFNGFNGNYWDYRRDWGCFSVEGVDKKSIASKNKIKEYDQLIMINGRKVTDFESMASEINSEYRKLISLIYSVKSMTSYTQEEIELLKQKYQKLDLYIPAIVLFQNNEVKNGYYLSPLPTGTILTFQDRSNDSKTFEIVVP